MFGVGGSPITQDEGCFFWRSFSHQFSLHSLISVRGLTFPTQDTPFCRVGGTYFHQVKITLDVLLSLLDPYRCKTLFCIQQQWQRGWPYYYITTLHNTLLISKTLQTYSKPMNVPYGLYHLDLRKVSLERFTFELERKHE